MPKSMMSIWFSPRQDNIDMSKPPGLRAAFTKYDFPAMLPLDAPWQTAASRIAVLTIGVHTMQHYDDLPAVISMINRYTLQVATAGAMVFTDGLCANKGIEGMDRSKDFAREVVDALRKWRDAGGRLDYIIMDGPFYFGYYFTAKDCHYSIAEVARRSAATFREIQKIYPAIKVMDAEGPGATPVDAWLPDLQTWLNAFKSATGHPVDAFGMDFQWKDNWHTGYDWVSALRVTTNFLHKQGIAAGLGINAYDRDVTNTQWMDDNRGHLKTAIDANAGLDFVIINSWMKYPERNLPESDPEAYTSLVNTAYSIIHAK